MTENDREFSKTVDQNVIILSAVETFLALQTLNRCTALPIIICNLFVTVAE
jgi:hypothetical protein